MKSRRVSRKASWSSLKTVRRIGCSLSVALSRRIKLLDGSASGSCPPGWLPGGHQLLALAGPRLVRAGPGGSGGDPGRGDGSAGEARRADAEPGGTDDDHHDGHEDQAIGEGRLGDLVGDGPGDD